MFGTLVHPRKPVLLLVVFGAFLMIVGITALAQAILASTTYSESILESVVGSDAATIRAVVNDHLTPTDIRSVGVGSSVASRLDMPLAALVEPGGIARIEIRRLDGTVLASDDSAVVGTVAPPTADFTKAVAGTPTAALVTAATGEALGAAVPPPEVLRAYFPIKSDGQVLAIVGLWRDGGPIAARLASVRQDVIIVTLTAGLLAAFVLFLVFRAAQTRIDRANHQLVEATPA